MTSPEISNAKIRLEMFKMQSFLAWIWAASLIHTSLSRHIHHSQIAVRSRANGNTADWSAHSNRPIKCNTTCFQFYVLKIGFGTPWDISDNKEMKWS